VALLVLVAFLVAVFVVAPNYEVCACPAAIFFFGFYDSNTSSGGFHEYNLTFYSAWTSNFTVAELRLSVVDENCSPVAGVLSLTLSYLNRSVFAVENGTTDNWVTGSSVVMPGPTSYQGGASGNLSITSTVDLSLDRLASTYVPGGELEDMSPLRPGYVPGTGIGGVGACPAPE
jgi:hypothetical protein